jgi:hypothetical protein
VRRIQTGDPYIRKKLEVSMRALSLATAAFAILGFAAGLPAQASEWQCKFKADRAGGIDVAGARRVVLRTGAGDLEVRGRSGGTRIQASGVACASTQELLDATNISVRREGDTAYVETAIPTEKLRDRDNAYAYLDIEVELPSNLPVDARDSSGDASLEDLAALTMQDSSGELDIERVKGAVVVNDSSGELRVEDAGSVELEDSSGDVLVARVTGSVEVVSDSSGELTIRDVGGPVNVRRDSSGDIRATDVRGTFKVGVDSSGSIYARNVAGDFIVESDGSGDIEHDNVKGRVSLPE